ncbi:MAG: pantetheine-phosphate adenylyltransferase [Clostridia bacterium]|nr:pantetheine-phosphate adenylyltransferase [Clostridia bacterium]
MKIAIYPGSFDPITNGHADIVKRAACVFDKVIVAVSVNSQKTSLFSIEERIELAKTVFSDYENVQVDTFTGLLVDYAQKVGAKTIIKGLRAVSDFEYEFQMAHMNKKLYPEVETMFMMSNQRYSYLSSSIVKEVGKLGGDLTGLVPEQIIDVIYKRLRRKS